MNNYGWIIWMFLSLLETVATCAVMLYVAHRGKSSETQAALDLAHKVAADAMLHLKAQSPTQIVQAKSVEKASEVSLETEKWLAERQRKEMEAEDSRRENTTPIMLKTADGKSVDLRDYENVG